MMRGLAVLGIVFLELVIITGFLLAYSFLEMKYGWDPLVGVILSIVGLLIIMLILFVVFTGT